MNKVHLLGAYRNYDRNVQTVSVNQVVVMEGYSHDSYVVYEVTRDKWGIIYHLINLRTYEFDTSGLIRPLSEKFGIGIYYDDANPSFLDPLETAALLTKAKEKKAETERKVKEEREEHERIAKIGAERLRPLIPTDAKAAIVGILRVNECDSHTDYYGYSIGRTVILGFSKHTRNLFSEMRKHAANFEGTAYFRPFGNSRFTDQSKREEGRDGTESEGRTGGTRAYRQNRCGAFAPPYPDGCKGGHRRHIEGERVRQPYGLLRLQYRKNRHFRLFQTYTQPLFGNAQACRQF